ncbi:hypothetical protein STEG23_005286 [Scotinomys teguina]
MEPAQQQECGRWLAPFSNGKLTLLVPNECGSHILTLNLIVNLLGSGINGKGKAFSLDFIGSPDLKSSDD